MSSRNAYTGPPATIGSTLSAGLDLIGDCTACHRDVRVGPTALQALTACYAATYGCLISWSD